MLKPGKDPATPESYDHPIFATEAGDLAHLTNHGHGSMRFEFVQSGSPYKVGDEVPRDMKTTEANEAAREWLANAGSPL